MTSGRLLRYDTSISAFAYEVVFKQGIDNLDADYLSRASVVQEEFSGDLAINSEVNCVRMTSVKKS
jgi:hypothetical protein